jgi:hypothetical protein
MARKVYTYWRWKVRRHGRKDGRPWRWKFWPFREPKQSSPRLEQEEPAAYEEELRQAAFQEIQWLSRDWKETDKKLKPDYCQALRKLHIARERYDKESKEETAAKQEFVEASNLLRGIRPPTLEKRWRNFWLILIALAEFPLNGLVFSIFGAERYETYIMAATMCFAIPWAAHFFGSKLKQEIRKPIEGWLVSIVPVAVLLGIGALAYLREKFFEALQTQELLGISIDPIAGTILFIVINILVFFVAVLISYEGAHNDEESFRLAFKRFKLAWKLLNKESNEARVAAEQLETAELSYQRARHKRETQFRVYAADAKHVKEAWEWLIRCYRDANMASRNDATKPKCFLKPAPEFSLPEELTMLDWNCEDVVNQ